MLAGKISFKGFCIYGWALVAYPSCAPQKQQQQQQRIDMLALCASIAQENDLVSRVTAFKTRVLLSVPLTRSGDGHSLKTETSAEKVCGVASRLFFS